VVVVRSTVGAGPVGAFPVDESDAGAHEQIEHERDDEDRAEYGGRLPDPETRHVLT